MKKNQLDDFKAKILENQNKFNIFTKDSVWNIEKRALKSNKKGMFQHEPNPSPKVYNLI